MYAKCHWEHHLAPPQGETEEVDEVDKYFMCLTTCDVDDKACVTKCVELLRDEED